MTDVISQFIERHGPERVCGVLEPILTPERIARIDQILAARLGSVVTVVEDTYDPHNAAATIRTTEALGIQELHVIERVHRFAVSSGVTIGAHRWLDLHRWANATEAVAGLKARGFRVFATLPGATRSIDDVEVDAPIAVMFGNEHTGLSEEAVAASDGAVVIPMFGFTESFNLSVTVGLAMSRVAARRREKIGMIGDLEAGRIARLRAQWFGQKIRGVEGILERALGAL